MPPRIRLSQHLRLHNGPPTPGFHGLLVWQKTAQRGVFQTADAPFQKECDRGKSQLSTCWFGEADHDKSGCRTARNFKSCSLILLLQLNDSGALLLRGGCSHHQCSPDSVDWPASFEAERNNIWDLELGS